MFSVCADSIGIKGDAVRGATPGPHTHHPRVDGQNRDAVMNDVAVAVPPRADQIVTHRVVVETPSMATKALMGERFPEEVEIPQRTEDLATRGEGLVPPLFPQDRP